MPLIKTRKHRDIQNVMPNWFPTPQEKLANETIVRVLPKNYLKKYGYRLAPIDFSVIPEMIRIVENTQFTQPFFRIEVMGHLVDAMNEDLVHYVRTQHFDLAGSRYWVGTGQGQRTVPRFMVLFRQAGGM